MVIEVGAAFKTWIVNSSLTLSSNFETTLMVAEPSFKSLILFSFLSKTVVSLISTLTSSLHSVGVTV